MNQPSDEFVRPEFNLDGPDKPTNTKRALRVELLEEAAKIIAGNRDQQYGGPEDSFQVIADLWSVYLGRTHGLDASESLSPADVATMMVLLKIARLMTGGPKQRDTWLDAAGYAACGWEVSS